VTKSKETSQHLSTKVSESVDLTEKKYQVKRLSEDEMLTVPFLYLSSERDPSVLALSNCLSGGEIQGLGVKRSIGVIGF